MTWDEVIFDLIDVIKEIAFIRQQDLRDEIIAFNDFDGSVAAKERASKAATVESKCSLLELQARYDCLMLMKERHERLERMSAAASH